MSNKSSDELGPYSPGLMPRYVPLQGLPAGTIDFVEAYSEMLELQARAARLIAQHPKLANWQEGLMPLIDHK